MKKVYITLFLFIIVTMFISGCGEEERMCRDVEDIPEETSIEKVYRIGLSQYLLETLDLEKYDRELSHSEMNYIPYEEEDRKKSDAQKRDKLGLTYIYLRNNLHLERLTKEETEILTKEAENEESDILSDEAMNVIVNTFPDVIAYKIVETPEDKKVMTGYDNDTDFVELNALVLKIGSKSEFDENGDYVSEEHEVEKQRALQEFSNRMEAELNGKLGDVPIRVRRDFSLFSEDGNGFMN